MNKTKLWARRLWGKSRKRAREADIEFDLTPEDIEAVFPERCPILHIELKYDKGINDCKPSLDRIRSDLGYVVGNIGVISWKANYLKGELTAEQLTRLAQYARGEL